MLLPTLPMLLLLLPPTLAKLTPIFSTRSSSFDPLQHLGGQSPYFPAPAQYGVSSALPAGCHIDQVSYLVRHGARYPTKGSYAGWVSLQQKIANATFVARGPLRFLPGWKVPVNDAGNETEMLSGEGALEAFRLGFELRQLELTPGGEGLTVWSASQQRVVDTAQWFLDGYLSQGHYNISDLGKIVLMADSVNYTYANSLTPTNSCPKFAENDTLGSNYRAAYKPAIVTRLNRYLDGLTLDVTDVGKMMDLCGYQTEISGYSPFCDVFTESEWLGFEYAQDLQYYYGSGPGNKMAGTSFWPYLKAVTELFLVGPNTTTPGSSFVPPPVLMAFTHDNDLSPLIAALGIFNETALNPTRITPKRTFRSSNTISSGGRIALERLACAATVSEPSFVKHIAQTDHKSSMYSSFVRIKARIFIDRLEALKRRADTRSAFFVGQ
ncbi:acid phosphatase, partial [Phenoliferia sp. Uapishka_3]